MKVTPVRSAPPSWAPLRDALGSEFEVNAGQIGAARVQPFQIRGFQHSADEAHRLVAHVGTQIRAGDRGSDEARASQVSCNVRLREIGAVEPGAKHL
jgi:hypothetical protein